MRILNGIISESIQQIRQNYKKKELCKIKQMKKKVLRTYNRENLLEHFDSYFLLAAI